MKSCGVRPPKYYHKFCQMLQAGFVYFFRAFFFSFSRKDTLRNSPFVAEAGAQNAIDRQRRSCNNVACLCGI